MLKTAIENRIQKWVNASLKFSDPQYCIVDIQQLGQTEIILLEMEQQVRFMIERQNCPDYDFDREPNPLLLSQVCGFSKYWIFGFYEVLRKYRDHHSTKGQKKFFLKLINT